MESRYKPPEHRREEWMREVRYRQRNVVYPETAMNGARFWRNLTSRKYPFTPAQKLCFVILVFVQIPPFAIFLATLIATLRGELPAWKFLIDLSTVATICIYAVILARALSAVFADTPPIPELPLSSRINMGRQAATPQPRS